jgi:hypothetical protein
VKETMTRKGTNEVTIPIEKISGKIYQIRGQKIMLDRDLAELYEVETKQLKRAVKRNIDRFPKDFMFELTKNELERWRRQFGTSKGEIKGLRYKPMEKQYDEQFRIVFEAITQLIEEDDKPKKKIGYIKERQVKYGKRKGKN